jgi:hypothetical protein
LHRAGVRRREALRPLVDLRYLRLGRVLTLGERFQQRNGRIEPYRQLLHLAWHTQQRR